MKDFGGLQIDVRCVKCGRYPTADSALYEMQNHLYICDSCRQDAEKKGKTIAWVDGAQPEIPTTSLAKTSKTQLLTPKLPTDSLFALLDQPLDAPVSAIETAIAEKMQLWMRRPNSPEKRETIDHLREWQEKISDDSSVIEQERERSKPVSRPKGAPLSVGGRLVRSAEEFLNACEESSEGWADGERYLRGGELRHWIHYQLGDRAKALEIDRYRKLTTISDFRALNEMLYCLIPERPFRFYNRDEWQPLSSVPSASAPEELAQLCDSNWDLGVHHLYDGSLGFWLETSQGIAGLKTYYDNAVADYAQSNRGRDRGLGLELLLEHAIPALPHPKLKVRFDNVEGFYLLDRWDRELNHRPISLTIDNMTRGFTSVDLSLERVKERVEPEWIALDAPEPVHIAVAKASTPVTRKIGLMNLHQLSRGGRYQRLLKMSILGEYGQPPTVEKFPITVKTLNYFQGLRGILWFWGLRGDIPGAAWNCAVGAILALLPLLLPGLIPSSYLNAPISDISFSAILQEIVAGTVQALGFLGNHFPLPLVVGVLLGLVAFRTGIGKGHSNYPTKQNSRDFRKAAFWLCLIFAVVLVFWDQGSEAIGQTFQYGGYYTLTAFLYYGGGSLIISFLIFLIACIVAGLRTRLEKYLSKRNEALLHPYGRT